MHSVKLADVKFYCWQITSAAAKVKEGIAWMLLIF